MAAGPSLTRLALFGSPVAHSLSPAIHQQFARHCGIEAEYQAIETRPQDFPQQVHEFAQSGGRGCNITVPLKQAAWELAQRSSTSAALAQAANTLVFNAPDDWFADNTDGRGLVADLARCLARPLMGCRILILGAGGAAAGILGDLLEQQPANILVCNRTVERAQTLVRRFSGLGQVSVGSWAELEHNEPVDLLINATSLGHAGLHPSLPAHLFSTAGLCYDLNYGQAGSSLKAWCEVQRVRYQDGLGMLVEQAALSFQLWTGLKPNSDEVLQTLRQSMAGT